MVNLNDYLKSHDKKVTNFKLVIKYFILTSSRASTEQNSASKLSNAIVWNTYFPENSFSYASKQSEIYLWLQKGHRILSWDNHIEKGFLHTAPNPYLSVDYHIWRTLLWVSSFRATRISGCLGHVCLSSLRLQGQEQKSASLQAAVERGKDTQLPPRQTDKDGTEGITVRTSPHAGFYHTVSELTGLQDNTPRTRTRKSHTAAVWVITYTHFARSSELLS